MALWTPAEISTSLWLEADDTSTITLNGSTVAEWRDKSGNTNHAAQGTAGNQPTLTANNLNGLDVISFDGNSDFLNLARTIAIPEDLIIISVVSRASAGIHTFDFGGTRSDTCPHGFWWYTNNIRYTGLGSTDPAHGSASTATGTFIVCSTRTGNVQGLRVNGTALADASSDTEGSYSLTYIGKVGTGQYHNGKIAETIVCTDLSQINKIEGYLAWRYGMEGNLPSGHPYKDAAPTIGNAIVSIVSCHYVLEGSLKTLLSQPYSFAQPLLVIFEQIYGLRLLTAIIQYYGDTPTFRRLLAQYYGSALVLRRICNHPYDDYLKFISAIDQEWSFPEFLRRILQQKYSISGSHLARIMDEQYNLSQYQLLRTLLDQVFVLPPSETLVQTPSVFVTADDILIDPHHVSIEIDEANFSIRGEIHLASEDDFLRCKHMQTTISITIDATEFVMLPDSPRRSRSELGHTEYYVPVVSPTVLLDAPNAEPITQAFSGSMASTIAADMANLASISLDWQLLDWYIPSATLYANNETPLAIIRKIVAAVGGILQTSPEGLLICRPEYPLTLPDWPTATPDFYLTDMDNFFSVDSTPVIREGYNRYLVSNQDAATAGLTLESTDITATSKKIRVYQVPWNEAATINLQTSGGDWVSIIADGIHTEEITDQVEIIAGSGRTSKPFYGMLLSAYLQDSLGTITVSEDGQITTEDSGNSLLHLTYTTRYHQFTVTDSHIEDVQFYPEEVEI